MKKLFSIIFFSLAGLAVVTFVVFFTRQILAKSEIEAEWLAKQTIVPPLAETSRLEIIPLYEEERASSEMISGHGVSYLIRTDSATILLDIGNNPDQLAVVPYVQNMQALGISWADVDRIVISHPHPDHMGGTETWWNATTSIAGIELPGGLDERFIFAPTQLAFKGAVHITAPTLPVPDVATTGVISFLDAFPFSIFEPKGSEQALVVHVAGEGLVLITSCGHPGLEKLVERAETLYGQPVIGVVGGLHYETATPQEVEPHIQFLQARQPGLVALSPHDSNPQVLAAFQSAFGDRYHTLRVGEPVQFP